MVALSDLTRARKDLRRITDNRSCRWGFTQRCVARLCLVGRSLRWCIRMCAAQNGKCSRTRPPLLSSWGKLAGFSAVEFEVCGNETRQKAVQVELHAAREMQRLILPPPNKEIFRVIRIALSIRDAFATRSICLQTLFTFFHLRAANLVYFLACPAAGARRCSVDGGARQSHLHAVLKRTGDPKQAVELLNAYLDGACPVRELCHVVCGGD